MFAILRGDSPRQSGSTQREQQQQRVRTQPSAPCRRPEPWRACGGTTKRCVGSMSFSIVNMATMVDKSVGPLIVWLQGQPDREIESAPGGDSGLLQGAHGDRHFEVWTRRQSAHRDRHIPPAFVQKCGNIIFLLFKTAFLLWSCVRWDWVRFARCLMSLSIWSFCSSPMRLIWFGSAVAQGSYGCFAAKRRSGRISASVGPTQQIHP